ncbi:PASTA domain-containing protein [Pseudonocardia spinosispora]|uniref:PASTA domain-containing protein n=1 Tax=Pseudonocardia spinosispora TaxID=103441 RepID=UPI00048B28A2|nr:PASTA domain-containing protein [Pseudonocardia spinosispora]
MERRFPLSKTVTIGAGIALMLVVMTLVFVRLLSEVLLPEPVAVPDVVNQEQSAARAVLVDAGFRMVIKAEPSMTIQPGRVTRTDPAAGTTFTRGAPITLVISTGPQH